MHNEDNFSKWEKRWHPLREEWVVYSAHRNNRPWLGAEKIQSKKKLDFDPNCYLCPGNARISGNINPPYKQVFVFENDHPVVGLVSPSVAESQGMIQRERAVGIAKVICYDPRHNISLAEMKLEEVQQVFFTFQQETETIKKVEGIKSVFIFENKGEAVGVSNPHPHCQIYATDFVFKNIDQQIKVANEHLGKTKRNIFADIIEQEQRDEVRILAENENAIGFIPYFARYAYEVMIFPKKHHLNLLTLTSIELNDIAEIFHQVVRKLDMNFEISFPYVMSVMQSPVDAGAYENFWMHIWIQPPYRQPGLMKYLAGPEIGAGNFMADTMPEDKAAELRKIDLALYGR